MTLSEKLLNELTEVRRSEFKIYAEFAHEMLKLAKQKGENFIMLNLRNLDKIDKQLIDEFIVDFRAQGFIVNIAQVEGSPYTVLNIKEK